MNNFDGEKMKY